MRWGFVGASNIAERVLPSLRKLPGEQVVAVVSRSQQRAADFAAQQGIAAAYAQLDAMLEREHPDAVYISSTNEQHHAQTLAALDAGCHVLCEKPLAMSVADGVAMVERARACGRVLATNHHLRASALHQRMRTIIAAGEIGVVHGVQVSHAVYLPPHLQGWRLDTPGAGGGVVLDILVHNTDLLRFLLGRNPQRIQTATQRNGLAQGDLEDGAMSVIEFDGGVLAQTHESFVAQHAVTRLHVLGTTGNLYAEGSLTQAGDGQLWRRDAGGVHPIDSPRVDVYEATLRAFVAACAGHGEVLASGADGVWSMATALAGLASARSGSTQPVEPGL